MKEHFCWDRQEWHILRTNTSCPEKGGEKIKGSEKAQRQGRVGGDQRGRAPRCPRSGKLGRAASS